MNRITAAAAVLCLGYAFAMPVEAQNRRGVPDENLKSTEILPDHRVVFRIYAPKASDVNLSGDWVAAS